MIPYILHVTIIVTACFLFYKLLLRKETFFRLNRWTLLACVGVSFALPLLPVPQQWSWRGTEGLSRAVISSVAPITPSVVPINPSSAPATLTDPAISASVQPAHSSGGKTINPSAGQVLTTSAPAASRLLPKIFKGLYWLYLFGVIIFGGNLLLQIGVLLYQSNTRPVVQDGPFRIVETSGDKAPCSFGHNIFINPSKYDWDTYNQILLHEKIHASGRHTIDILLAEILIVCQWFNPFAWLYRKEIENNLEFLTDQSLLQNHEVEPSAYQLSLLKVAVPNLPYGITTNYNQSLLKRRIIMMNSKKSSLHTIWKYFFLLPLLTCLVCALNKPIVLGQPTAKRSGLVDTLSHPDRSEGSWFATTKGEKLCFEFKGDKDEHSWSSNSCVLKSDLTPAPGMGKTAFRLVRESGIINFTGQFDGEQGYGHYSFKPDENYIQALRRKGIGNITEDDMLAFFLLDIKNEYLDMLQKNGYPHVSKNNLIAMSAMNIDFDYIRQWREMGYPDISENDIIAVKAMNIDKAYVEDLRSAGYANLGVNRIIAFKAQGIDGQYIKQLNRAQNGDMVTPVPTAASPATTATTVSRSSAASGAKASTHVSTSSAPTPAAPVPAVTVPGVAAQAPVEADDLIALKSLNIDPQYIASLKAAGYANIPAHDLITMRSLNIDAAFIKSFEAVGYKDIPVQSIVSIKSLDITPDFIKGFRDIGYKDISLDQLPALKSMGITPDFVKEFRNIGFNNISLDQLPALKSLGITAAYVTKMKGQGFVSDDLNKYIQLKSAFQ